MERQIAACERYAQTTLGLIPEDLSSLQPTLQEQARMYQRYQLRMLHGLRDDAALMTVEIASTAPISHVVADAVGALLTEPAGGTQRDFDGNVTRYLAGGYEVVELSVESGYADAFKRVELQLPPNPLAPPDVQRLPYLFDSVEATAGFRLPPATVEAPLGLSMRSWREQPAPANLPEEGLLVGSSVVSGVAWPVRIATEDRLRHIYVVGQTGTGKTTLLKTMILDDI